MYNIKKVGVLLMKRKLLAVMLALIVITTTVCIWYYTSYPTIGVGKMVALENNNFEKEFHSERISITSAVVDFLPDSPLQKQKIDEVKAWNDPIALELAEYSKEGGLAYNIVASGEIKDGKTTLCYDGYIIKKDGKRIDYKEEKTFDFVICSEERFFTDKL